MSRTQWCCLAAVLAVVLGLFAAPVTAGAGRAVARVPAPAPAVAGPVPVAGLPSGAAVDGPAPDVRQAGVAPGRTDSADSAPPPATTGAPVGAVPVRAGADDGSGDPGVPGCDRDRGHPGADPVLPARNRVPHDQAPGCAVSGPVAATVRGLLPSPALIAIRATRPAAPTPVELSVLRV
ncbi:hypothetical protein STHAL_10955 [Streptomyces halstedii]|uniref:Uncharacterized protein n=1 Tax=Streptomyces halstedii TaxID=1944 RepID=A0ABS6TP00_STRHA|nr:hypothetical protein [Streptomyces halstedii]MBV7669993.1 hypothetical protein [Streptomyces halstedii]